MKEIITKAAGTVTKIAIIYVVLMAAIFTGVIGIEIPELGFTVLMASGLITILLEILNKGGNGHDSRNGT